MANYVVGDIQGCYDPLRRLLDKLAFDPASDRLWCVGDLVSRGDKSLKTLRFLSSLPDDRLNVVLGNHDLHLLAAHAALVRPSAKDRLDKLLNAPDVDELCDWLRHRPLLHHERLDTQFGNDSFLMIHAGLAPSWSAEQARALAAEVETVLRGDNYHDFLATMYGDTPDTWSDQLTGYDRLRMITSYLTRTRFCKRKGKLDFKIKTGAGSAAPGYRPWFEFQTLSHEHVLLFGHWAALEGVTNMPRVYALDTGCVWGRCMTALRLEDRQRFNVDCGG